MDVRAWSYTPERLTFPDSSAAKLTKLNAHPYRNLSKSRRLPQNSRSEYYPTYIRNIGLSLKNHEKRERVFIIGEK